MNPLTDKIGNIGTLLVLGGEGSQRKRSKRAATIYNNTERTYSLPIHLTGGHWIANQNVPDDPEAEQMKQYLQKTHDVNEEDLLTETTSVDTLTNFIFAKPNIEQILSGDITKRIGVVTDDFHMQRALWCGQTVFNSEYNFHPFTTGNNDGTLRHIKENIIQASWAYDLNQNNFNSEGDAEEQIDFIREKHPGYTDTPEMTAYNALVTAQKLL